MGAKGSVLTSFIIYKTDVFSFEDLLEADLWDLLELL
jgi:hypothetical protein